MDVNRSGYYKWRKRKGKPNRYEQDRILLTPQDILEKEGKAEAGQEVKTAIEHLLSVRER